MVLQVLGQEYGSHPAAADLGIDGLAVCERRFETLQEVGHASIPGTERG